jgi:hypothetical protein
MIGDWELRSDFHPATLATRQPPRVGRGSVHQKPSPKSVRILLYYIVFSKGFGNMIHVVRLTGDELKGYAA